MGAKGGQGPLELASTEVSKPGSNKPEVSKPEKGEMAPGRRDRIDPWTRIQMRVKLTETDKPIVRRTRVKKTGSAPKLDIKKWISWRKGGRETERVLADQDRDQTDKEEIPGDPRHRPVKTDKRPSLDQEQ